MTDPHNAPDAPRKNPLSCGLAGIVRWMPVWAPLGLLAQVGILGLRPALQEDLRLQAAEARLEQRLAGLREERGELEHELDALQDPIYIERLRRLRDE